MDAMRARMNSSVVVSALVTGALAFSTASLAQAGSAAALEERVANSEWSDASWRADLDAEAELARLTHPDADERLSRLDGLSPERYLARRRPEPEAAREITRLVRDGVVPAALVADLFVEGVSRYPFSSAERFQKKPAAEVERLRRMEREQLNAGLLLALGDSRHASAVFVSREAFIDDKRPMEERRVAALALGKTRDARAVTALSAVALDEKASLDLRTAALAGLAHVRSLNAVTTLGQASRTASDPTLQRAIAISLGASGSAWALANVASDDAVAMRSAASAALVDLLERASEPKAASAVVDAIGMVADESAKSRLRAIMDDGRRPAALRERAARAERRLERALRRNAR